MKTAIHLIGVFLLMAVLGNSQVTSKSVVGNYVGEFTWQKEVGQLEVLPDNQYVLELYDWRGEQVSTIKGRWSLDGEKLILTEKVGTITVLNKNNDMWYVVADNGYSFFAKFYYNKSLKEYMAERRSAGC